MAHILFISDDISSFKFTEGILATEGHSLEYVQTLFDARRCFKKRDIDLVLFDRDMAEGSALKFLRDVACKNPDTAVVILTKEVDFNKAKYPLETGAYDYLIKPVDSCRLMISIIKALVRRDVESESRKQIEFLRQSHKEEIKKVRRNAVCRITGAVCHEINQPLQAISISLYMLQEDLKANSSKKIVKSLWEEYGRLSTITHKLADITKYRNRQSIPN